MTTKKSLGKPGADTAELAALAERLKIWRASRGRGECIPAALWQAAGELARIHGLNPTAAALRLNYYDLQRRMRGGRAPRRGRPRRATFIEVPALPLPASGGEGGTVELVQGAGGRLILRLPNAAAKDLLPVVRMFLRQRR
jgi:hypothetical protein